MGESENYFTGWLTEQCYIVSLLNSFFSLGLIFMHYPKLLLWHTKMVPNKIQFSSVTQSCLTLWPHGLQHARLPCPSPTPGVYSNSCPLNQWSHPTVSASIVPFSSCLHSLPASGSFPMSQFFPSGGQSIGVSASTSIFPMNFQDWFPVGWTSRISSMSKGCSRVFSNSTVQKHQCFGTQLSL